MCYTGREASVLLFVSIFLNSSGNLPYRRVPHVLYFFAFRFHRNRSFYLILATFQQISENSIVSFPTEFEIQITSEILYRPIYGSRPLQ